MTVEAPADRWAARALSVVVALAVVAALLVTAFGAQRLRHYDEVARTASTPSGPTPPHASPTTSSPSPGSDDGYHADDVDRLLLQVRVLPRRPAPPGYDRDCGPGDGCVFGTEWTDDSSAPDGHDGCDTRNDVLAAQLIDVEFVADSPDCDVVGGYLLDPYTGTRLDYATDGSQIHIDHLFPLAAAWDLGAFRWSKAARTAFANDTALELVAVSAGANLSKGDSTPASWLPPDRTYRCTYVARYLEVAVAYDLAITRADRTVIGFVRDRACPA